MIKYKITSPQNSSFATFKYYSINYSTEIYAEAKIGGLFVFNTFYNAKNFSLRYIHIPHRIWETEVKKIIRFPYDLLLNPFSEAYFKDY